MPAKSYARELVRQRTGRDVEELLRELYVDRRHSQEAIAKSLGVSRGAVVAWLADYGISRDDREPLPPLVQA